MPFSPLCGARLPRSPKAGRGNSSSRASSSGRTSSSEARTRSTGQASSSSNSSERSLSPEGSVPKRRDHVSHFDTQTPAQWTANTCRLEHSGRQTGCCRPSSPVLAERRSRANQNMLHHALDVSAREHRHNRSQSASRRAGNDMQPFSPQTWLDDANISAVYSRLSEQSGGSSPQPVLLLEPSVVFWLALSEKGSVRETVQDLKLGAHQVVLCPINDCQHRSRVDSGTHWSLLVCVARPLASSGWCEFEFHHYDSAGSSSRSLRQAQRVAEKLGGRGAKVRPGLCAQQVNCFDCGVYVLMFSQIILNMTPPGGFGSIEAACACISSWEKAFFAVTPRQATEYRMRRHKAFSDPYAGMR